MFKMLDIEPKNANSGKIFKVIDAEAVYEKFRNIISQRIAFPVVVVI